MNRLQTELRRLYAVDGLTAASHDTGAPVLADAEGRVRCMVLSLARPASWSALSSVWQGVQADLSLPAPAIAVNGVDGIQLWFSLARPVPADVARLFLERLRHTYLSDLKPARVDMAVAPAVDTVPTLRHETGHWSAFVAADLAAVFADEPWLDMEPLPDPQAEVLGGLKSMAIDDFEAALARLGAAPETAAARPAPALMADSPKSVAPAMPPVPAERAARPAAAGPRQFLLDVMADPAVDLRLRIEAARALLPYFEPPPAV